MLLKKTIVVISDHYGLRWLERNSDKLRTNLDSSCAACEFIKECGGRSKWVTRFDPKFSYRCHSLSQKLGQYSGGIFRYYREIKIKRLKMRIVIYEEETGNAEELNINCTKEKIYKTLDGFRKNINFNNTVSNLKSIEESNNIDTGFVYWINVSNNFGTAIVLVYTSDEFDKKNR